MKWANIEGFPMYIVSDTGRVRRVGCNDLRPRVVGAGYIQVVLYREGKRHAKYVHVLVAQAFVQNDRAEANEVNHKDAHKTNCSAKNLEWSTHAENMRHAHAAGRFTEHRKKMMGNLHAKGISRPFGLKTRKQMRQEILAR